MPMEKRIPKYKLGDYVPKWNIELGRRCGEAMRSFPDPVFYYLSRRWKDFARMVIDFAVDVTHGARLWRGYEVWNLRHFGVALPVTEGDPGDGLSTARLTHFIWRALSVLDQEVTPSPNHPDVQTLVKIAETFLKEHLPTLPAKANPEVFFSGPQDAGHEVKSKLIVLGIGSYFFRDLHTDYAQEESDIRDSDDPFFHAVFITDDFLCQECTCWSGMGVVDLLAEVIDLPAARLEDLRGWRSRHVASFRIDAVDGDILRVTSLVNDQEYRVACPDRPAEMKHGTVVFGMLAPWDGVWIWSGGQMIIGHGRKGEQAGRALRDDMKRRPGDALCRSWPEYRAQVMELSAMLRAAHMEFREKRDLVVYPDEELLEADRTLFMEELRNIQVGRSKRGKPPAQTEADFKDAFRKKAWHGKGAELSPNAAASFFNSDEGIEDLFGYHDLCAAFNKRGIDLSEDERSVLRDFVQSTASSPVFVRRMLRDYPPEALYREFGISPEAPPSYALDWLLRCWKGQYFRPRYPAVSAV